METKDRKEDKHDDREIDVRSILTWGGAVVGVTIAALLLMWFFWGSLTQSEHANQPARAPIADELPTTPPEPRLQPSPPIGLAEFRAHEQEVLTSYRWSDADRGLVSIPITDAIELLARRGLPSREAPPPSSSVTVPTGSSLEPPARTNAAGTAPAPAHGEPSPAAPSHGEPSHGEPSPAAPSHAHGSEP